MRKTTVANQSGITFVEVMMTVAILSVSLVMILQSFIAALEALKRSQNIAVASSFLQKKMEELKLKAFEENGCEKGVLSGQETAPDGRPYQWQLTVSPVNEQFNSARLEIHWREGGWNRQIIADTYLKAKSNI